MDIATTLLEYGAKSNAESVAGFTPLHLSASEGHSDMSAMLIEHEADVNHAAKVSSKCFMVLEDYKGKTLGFLEKNIFPDGHFTSYHIHHLSVNYKWPFEKYLFVNFVEQKKKKKAHCCSVIMF